MDEFRKRCLEAKQSDNARGKLLDDMLQKINDMQKMMDRNSFIMVLIDGDCMNFLDSLIKQGMTGGEEAAKSFRKAIFDYVRYTDDFKHDHKIVVRVYANVKGLSKAYIETGILTDTTTLYEFVEGFNKAHSLCDFIDTGSHNEAVTTKLRETLNLYAGNVHCKHVLFGASANDEYTSFLRSRFVDTDATARISLLRGPPFASELGKIVSRFRWTEFNSIFRSDLIFKSDQLTSHENQESSPSPKHDQALNGTKNLSWQPKKVEQARPSKKTAQINLKCPSPDLMEFPDAERTGIDDESDSNDADANAKFDEIREDQLSTRATGSSVRSSSQESDEVLTAIDIENALISCTNERLEKTPKSLDFGFVKQSVEEKLDLPSNFWEEHERGPWNIDSKSIIKLAIEDWVERTNNPPPKNATWMLRFFKDAEESPSSVIKNPASMAWRTKRVPISSSPVITVGRRASHDNPNHDQHREDSRQPLRRTRQTSNTPPKRGSRGDSRQLSTALTRNSAGQRLDVHPELNPSLSLVNALRGRKPRLCNFHYLVGDCSNRNCQYEHDHDLNDDEFEALVYICRSQVCPQGSSCTIDNCLRGHMCPTEGHCARGPDCKFVSLHGIDTVAAIDRQLLDLSEPW